MAVSSAPASSREETRRALGATQAGNSTLDYAHGLRQKTIFRPGTAPVDVITALIAANRPRPPSCCSRTEQASASPIRAPQAFRSSVHGAERATAAAIRNGVLHSVTRQARPFEICDISQCPVRGQLHRQRALPPTAARECHGYVSLTSFSKWSRSRVVDRSTSLGVSFSM
jgi:hypothetical protein